MKKSLIKNLKTMGLALSCVFAIGANRNDIKTTVVSAEEAAFGGYYETSLNESVIKVEGISGNITSVSVNEKSVPSNLYALSGENVTLKKSSDSGAVLNTLDLGEEYLLNVTTDDGEYSAKFKYVTLAIRKATDLAVFNTDENDRLNQYKDAGYYVLANDIEYDKNFKNNHSASKGYADGYKGEFGFAGTFDGQGHTISYQADADGIFGGLTGATIKNVAFMDIVTSNCSVLAGCAWGDTRVENVYCRTAQGRTAGLIAWLNGTGIEFRNVVTEFPDASKDYPKLSGGVGALFSFDVNLRWTEPANRNFDTTYENVYAISKCPLAKFGNVNASNVMWWEDYYLAENEAYITSSGEGVTRAETYVIKNVKKYDTMLAMKNADNDYTGFDAAYWDISNGVPIFKGTEKSLRKVAINGEVKNTATLYSNTEENSCKIDITLNTLPLDIETVLEVTEGANYLSISGNTVTAVANGIAKIKVTAKDGSFPEKVVTVLVKTYTPPVDSSQSNDLSGDATDSSGDNNSVSSGCSGSIVGCGVAASLAGLLLGKAALDGKRRKGKEESAKERDQR